MISFFDSSYIDMYDVVEKGNYQPFDEENKEVPRDKWTNEQKIRYYLNSKARNAIICALSKEKYTQVHSFKSVKQMWVTLAITYEGSS